MQLLYIALVWWTSVRKGPENDERPDAPELTREHGRPSREGAPARRG